MPCTARWDSVGNRPVGTLWKLRVQWAMTVWPEGWNRITGACWERATSRVLGLGGGWLAGPTLAKDGFPEEVMSQLSPEGCWVSRVPGCCSRGLHASTPGAQETSSGAGAEHGWGVASDGIAWACGH